jgi:shikimate dehydrogenase
MPVDGSTRVLGVVGDPIAQVRAPGIWTALFRHNAVNAVCVPMHVRPGDLRAFFGGVRTLRNLVGLIVTIPHKPAILELIDAPTARATAIGAANAIAFREDGSAVADHFDGVGFVNALRASGQRLDGRRALIVGAGGVGSAIAFGVAEAGARQVSVSDIDAARAQALAARLGSAGYAARVAPNDPAGSDLVVNATPLGMRADDRLPFDCARLEPSAIVGDVVVSATPTPVLAAAVERGCFVQAGAAITDHQIAALARFFGFDDGDWSARTIARLEGGR